MKLVLMCAAALLLFSGVARADSFGGAFGGGLLGGAIGGVLGGVISGGMNRPQYYPQPRYYSQPQYYPPPLDPISYCMQRFRSYNPETGLYIGYDGQYHRCP